MSAPFRPDQLETAPAPDRQDIKLIFRCDDGRALEVVLARRHMPEIIAEFVKWIPSGNRSR